MVLKERIDTNPLLVYPRTLNIANSYVLCSISYNLFHNYLTDFMRELYKMKLSRNIKRIIIKNRLVSIAATESQESDYP